MNLNFAEKIGIFFGATVLTFAIGVVACSPVAPSIDKSSLSSRSVHQENENKNVTPNPVSSSSLHLLLRSTRDDATATINTTLVLSKDGYDWFFKGQEKTSQLFRLSVELPGPLAEFKREGKVRIPTQPSAEWQPNSEEFSGKAYLQFDLSNTALSPTHLEGFGYTLKGPSLEEYRSAIENHSLVYWNLKVNEGIDPNTRNLILGALDGIYLSVNSKETSENPPTPVTPAPTPNPSADQVDQQ